MRCLGDALRRAPHLPLDGDPDSSLLDLFDIGHFALLAGPDGSDWVAAARSAADVLGVPLKTVQIGKDVTVDIDAWFQLYGVSAEGAVLVRPDGHVAWRSGGSGSQSELRAALAQAVSRSDVTVSA